VKLCKSSLLIVSGPFAVAVVVWGLLYFSQGLIVPGSIPFIYGLLSVGTIIQFCSNRSAVENKAASVQQKFMTELKKVIDINLDNDRFRVDELIGEMIMSRSQLHRKLKAMTNQSATTFIRNYRLHRAAELLRQDAGNVTEIAYRVGFNSRLTSVPRSGMCINKY
jgi:AraC-like DNA-binding protein